MGRLQTKVAECEYKEYDMLLTEQLMGGLDEEAMISEILREIVALEDIEDAISERILI